MKQIPLSQGKFALVDDEHYEFLMQWKWTAYKDRGVYYAIRSSTPRKSDLNQKSKSFRMHRVLMDAKKGEMIDHADGDGLNNQMYNLRKASNSQNQMNRSKTSLNTSGFKGVSFDISRNKYAALICINGEKITIGRFSNAIEAAKAYNKKAIELHGEFAKLNEIP